MTKRTQTNKPKATPTVVPTINSTAPTSPVESVKAETKAKVASKGKQANSTAKKGISAANKSPAKPRGRSKKIVAEPTVEVNLPAPVSKAIDVDSRTITYVDPRLLTKHVVTDYGVEPQPSKYEQFKAWLVFKLYVVTSYFRGF